MFIRRNPLFSMKKIQDAQLLWGQCKDELISRKISHVSLVTGRDQSST
uniref:Uncharacterized protein n=1 Tax=Rhizophora mucronata TaxID=61149 RepID=A0A2P2NTI3_RHIMU